MVSFEIEKLIIFNLLFLFFWNSSESDEEQVYNQTQLTSDELMNKKNKEIVRSQQILLVLIFGLIILLFAISKIIMSLGKSIDNRKYLLMQYW